MRLYLSSFRIGDGDTHLVSMLDGGRSVAVIANSMDPYERRGLDDEFLALEALGLKPRELDLRDYFEDNAQLADDLRSFNLVWVRGGNVFALRHAMAKSGADRILVALLNDDAFVYGGYSAGPCVLAPSLRGLELVDDMTSIERLYGEPPIFDGLGIIDFAFVPHVDSPGHPETELMKLVIARYLHDGTRHRTFRDGQVLVIDGDNEIVVGT